MPIAPIVALLVNLVHPKDPVADPNLVDLVTRVVSAPEDLVSDQADPASAVCMMVALVASLTRASMVVVPTWALLLLDPWTSIWMEPPSKTANSCHIHPTPPKTT